MATKTAKDWNVYTDGRKVMECEGGPYSGWGFFVDEFIERQGNARRMGYTGEDRGGCALRYRPSTRTRQSSLKDFEGNPQAQVEVWIYADQPDLL